MGDLKGVKLGIAPIAWTNDDMPELGAENTFEQCVSEMALAGYKGTEIGNKYPKDPAVLNPKLSIRGLTVASAWFSSFLTTKPFEETAVAFKAHRDFLKAGGAKVIVVSEQGHSIQGQPETPVFENKPSLDDAGWDKLARGLEKLGELAAEKGMAVVYHHHMGTVVQTSVEIDRLMAMTDPAKVSLLFDSGHLKYSGEEPVDVLMKHIARVKHVHLKDIRPEVVAQVKAQKLSFLKGVRMGAFTVPGDGCIDFSPIFKALSDAGYEGWWVVEAEQDPAIANPLEYAVKARKYIADKAGI